MYCKAIQKRDSGRGCTVSRSLPHAQRGRDAGFVRGVFNLKLQLIKTNTLTPETAQGTISVGSKLRYQDNKLIVFTEVGHPREGRRQSVSCEPQ